MTLRNFNEAYKNGLVILKKDLFLKARILSSGGEAIDLDLDFKEIDDKLYDSLWDRKILDITQEGKELIFHIEKGNFS